MRIMTYLSSFAGKNQGLRCWYDDVKYNALVLMVDDKMFTTKNPRVISCDLMVMESKQRSGRKFIKTSSDMIAQMFNELCECNYTKASTYNTVILSICETIRAFSLFKLRSLSLSAN